MDEDSTLDGSIKSKKLQDTGVKRDAPFQQLPPRYEKPSFPGLLIRIDAARSS
jgi:hypothetical protein